MQSSHNGTISFSVYFSVLVFSVTSSNASVWYADAESTSAAPTGTNWCDAYRNLQDALAAASFGDEVRVADGVYRPDDGAGQTVGDRLATFVLKSGVTVVGGYAGCGAADPDARDLVVYETILSGDLGGDDEADFTNRTDNSYHVVTYNDPAATGVVLDGFTVSAGYADGTGPAGTQTNQGAGIHLRLDSTMCIPGGPTIRNCVVRDNWTANHGAINIHTDAALIENCTIRDNHSNIKGGGLLIQSGNAIVRDCSFVNNTALSEGGGAWTAHNEDSTCAPQSQPLIENCTFLDNVSHDKGGGLFVLSGDATVRGTDFINNSATLEGGGAWIAHSLDPITAPQGQHLFEECTFVDNRAQSPNDNIGSGGGLSVANGNVVLRNCEFTNNVVSRSGGGVWIRNCDDTPACARQTQPLIEGCVFTGNRAEGLSLGLGGALYYQFIDLVVRNTSFVQNHAMDNGGAIYGGSSNAAFEACTWDRNTADLGGGYYHIGINTILTIDDSVFQNNHADPFGGGLYVYAGSPRISGTTFHANSAETSGGGAFIFQDITFGCEGFCQTCDPGFCEAFLTDCVFRQNQSLTGGGLTSGYSAISILNRVVFEENLAYNGGGMFQDGLNGGPEEALTGSVLLTDCVFRRNGNLYDTGYGGGMFVRKGLTTLIRCDFLENEQPDFGGGLYAVLNSWVNILNSRFLGNKLAYSGSGLGGWGAGVCVQGESTLFMTNTLVSGNSIASLGGGVAISGPGTTAVILNSTIAGNSVVNPTGGDALLVNNADVLVRNSIMWNGPAGQGEPSVLGGTSVDILYSIVEGGWTGTGNMDIDPQFVDAAGPDGILGTTDDDWRLSFTSPGVDAGNFVYLPEDSEDLDGDGDTTETIPYDLNNAPRVLGSSVDMGAFERGTGPCEPGSFSPSGDEPCDPCPAGRSQPDSGATDCLGCAPGTFAALPGSVACSDCLAGEFQPDAGALSCLSCTCDDGNPCTTDNCDSVSGNCQPDPIENCIPATSEWGILALALMVLTAGTLVLRRPRLPECG